MSEQVQVCNPFMLLISPEVVLAAMKNSAHLGKLNSTMCRPLDGPAATAGADDSADEALEATGPINSAN